VTAAPRQQQWSSKAMVAYEQHTMEIPLLEAYDGIFLFPALW